jgi:hypothetical protein
MTIFGCILIAIICILGLSLLAVISPILVLIFSLVLLFSAVGFKENK